MMSWIDWLVIIVPTLIIGCVAVMVQPHHVKSVADFHGRRPFVRGGT